MAIEKQYIEIKIDLTLNTDKNGTADMRKPNELQILKNYIPGRGALRTRKGITVFSHSPKP